MSHSLITISFRSSTFCWRDCKCIWILSKLLTKFFHQMGTDLRHRVLIFHVVFTFTAYWKLFLCNRNIVYCIATVVVFIVFRMYMLSFDIQMCLCFDILDVLFFSFIKTIWQNFDEILSLTGQCCCFDFDVQSFTEIMALFVFWYVFLLK